VLLALLENRGEVVTRERLQKKLWPDKAFGDFDHGLNIAINKIREALGDSADTPRFVETLPRHGYRFICPVEGAAAPPTPMPGRPPAPMWVRTTGAARAAMLLTATAAWLATPSAAPALEWRRLTNDNLVRKFPPVLSDGVRLYFIAGPKADRQLFQVPLTGGEPAIVPILLPPGPDYLLFDITRDGQELLMGARPTTVLPFALWTVRIADGSSRRVSNLQALSARYSPAGDRFAFTTDGRRTTFGQRNRATDEVSAWEIHDGAGLRRLLPNWQRNHLPAGWTPDGDLLLNSEGQFWIGRQRRFYQLDQPAPAELSAGEPYFNITLQSMNARTLYAIGRTPLGQLQRFDTRSRDWVPSSDALQLCGTHVDRTLASVGRRW
jgi:hypothetical protein